MEKSRWQGIKLVLKGIKLVWKVIVALSIVLGLVVAILKVSGRVDFWSLLILPLYNFFTLKIPIYYATLFIIACFLSYYSIIKLRNRKEGCVLDLEYARKIALLCQTPRTTEFIKQQYHYWLSQERTPFIGRYGFDDYMKRLEEEGFLEYINGKWQVKKEALEYIKKYHGE